MFMEWFKDWSLPACEAKSNLQWGFFPISVNWYGLGHSNTKGDRNVEKKHLQESGIMGSVVAVLHIYNIS